MGVGDWGMVVVFIGDFDCVWYVGDGFELVVGGVVWVVVGVVG